MAEIIAEPTALSKVIALKFKINDVDVPKTTQLSTNKQFNTTDTDAWFTFELDGLASTSGTYNLTLINLDDKSIFHHADVIFPALPFHYKLNSSEDVTLNEIRHAGRWLGQLVVTMSNGDTTARQFGFNIAGHILDGQDAQVILLSDYQALINTINLAKDDLAQYNVDYAALIADVTAAEGLREQAEIYRAATFDALVESEMVAQNVATKLAEKEATFAPRMLSLESELAEIVQINVKNFGAKGDGITNDTKAFQDASAAFNALGGGKFVIPEGDYIVGKQTFAGATGKGYSFLAQDIIKIENCVNPVIIEGSGAKLKADPSLRFGSFDPVTGDIYNPTMPFVGVDYRADAYPGMVEVYNCGSVVIRDIDLDGNMDNIVLGGEWGDQGRQCKAYGIVAIGNANLKIDNVNAHHHCLDGVLIGYDGLTIYDEAKPMTLVNVECQHNARQGLTWDSGNRLVAINSKFNHQGTGRFGSSPSSGVDIETGNGNICRNGLFLNCEFIHNLKNGMVADSGDSADVKFSKCTFWASSGGAIFPNKPNFTFEDCKIYGAIQGIYQAENYKDATKFIRCEIEDKPHAIYGMESGTYLISVLGSYASFFECNIIANNRKSFFISGSSQRLYDCTITHKATVESDGFQCLLNNALLKRVTFKEAINVNDTNNYYISIGTPFVEDVTVEGAKVLWAATTPNGASGKIISGITEYANHNDLVGHTFRAIGLAEYGNSRPAVGARLMFCGTSAPTTGTWQRGDRVFNSNPAVGQPKTWVCTESGIPGTWVSEGNL